MKLIAFITAVLLEQFTLPVYCQLRNCGGLIDSSGTTSYKLNEHIAKNERCVWISRIRNAVTYTVNVRRGGSYYGRELTRACISIGDDGKTEMNQIGVMDTEGSHTLQNPCHVLVMTLYSENEPDDGKGFEMRFSAEYGSPKVSSQSKQTLVRSYGGLIRHPPTGKSVYSENESSTFVFTPPGNRCDLKRVNLVTYSKISLESSTCHDHLLVYKLRVSKTRSSSWRNALEGGVDKICGDTQYKMWASDDLILVIFRSDGSVNNEGFNLLHANMAL